VITDRTQLDALGGVWQGARHIPGAQAAIVLLLPKPPEERFITLDRYDLGQATYAMLLAATDLGIGTAHSSISDQEKARQILGFPDGYIAAYMIGLGYPADRPLRPIIKPDGARSRRSCTRFGHDTDIAGGRRRHLRRSLQYESLRARPSESRSNRSQPRTLTS
jgi:nitroreductase